MKKSLGDKINDLFQETAVAIVPQSASAASSIQEVVRLIAIERIRPSALQPRKIFQEDKLLELAHSILENGFVQPIIVRPNLNQGFDIIAGERRYRAALLAKMKEIPVIVRPWNDTQTALAAIVENIQRENLKPTERAEAFSELVAQFGWKQNELAEKLGLSRSQVANTLRLLKLDPLCLECLNCEKISEGHAKILASLAKPDQKKYLELILKKQWSVRQLEDYLKKKTQPAETKKPYDPNSLYANHLAQKIQDYVLTQVDLRFEGEQKGRLIFSFENHDSFIGLLEKLGLSAVFDDF